MTSQPKTPKKGKKELGGQGEHSKEPKTKGKSDRSERPLRYGPMPVIPMQRTYTRVVFIVATLVVALYTAQNKKDPIFATVRESIPQRVQNVDCSASYSSEMSLYPGCVPEKCGRMVTDTLIEPAEVEALLELALGGFAHGGSDGGASILDLHSGALSKGTGFINVYSLDESKKQIFKGPHLNMYKIIKTKILHAISHTFGVDVGMLHLTHPTFFSKMTHDEPKSIHDQYWLEHVDKETYEAFHYTSLLYLSNYQSDFTGGRFFFTAPSNITVEPRRGRVLMFTSGAENPHLVERVESGTRYALTVSFTCNKELAIDDPHYK